MALFGPFFLSCMFRLFVGLPEIHRTKSGTQASQDAYNQQKQLSA
jgi:hypothetical protein